MARQYDLDTHFGSALHYRVEVFHLEPEEHTIAVGFIVAIADVAMMMLDFKAVQLQDELAILHQLLILRAAVNSAAAQQALIPLTAGFNIGGANERLGAHGPQLNRTLDFSEQILKELQRHQTSVCDGDDDDGDDGAQRHLQEQQQFPPTQQMR